MQLWGECLLCCFLFCLSLFSPILSHQSVLRYFNIGEVDSRNRIRVPRVGYIIYQYQLLLIRYIHAFLLRILNRDACSFSHNFIH